jgi:hypothetical protein
MPCTDTAPPEKFSPKQLNLLADFMESLPAPEKDRVWKSLPHDLRMEFVYANWRRTSR